MAGRGVTVDFNANVARFTSSVDKVTNDLNRFQTNAERTSRNIDQSFARLGGNIRNVFGGLTAALGVRELGAMADSFQNIQARLKLATRGAEEFAQANENIKRIAESSKSPLESTAILYTRISQSLLDVGGTQAQVASTTQALALALRLSGANAAESASAMLQFSQAIGSGVLRGEEFNAVNEAAPRAMKALADALGVPIGQLRNLAQEGKITRDILVEALGSQLPQLLKEAETLPNTIGASLTDLSNKLLLTIGELDKLTGASGKAANFIGEAGRIALETIVVLGANVAFVFKTVYNEITGIGRQLAALGRGDLKGFVAISEAVRADADRARKELDAFEQQVLNPKKLAIKPPVVDEAAAKRLRSMLGGGVNSGAAKAAEKAAKAAADERQKLLQHEMESELEIFSKFHKDREKAAKDSQDALDALNREGQSLKLSVDPLAKMNAELARYRELLSKGVIDQRTFNLAVEKSIGKTTGVVKDEFGKMSAAAIGFQTNVQSTLGQGLYNGMKGNFDGIFDLWTDLLFRMVSAGLASKVTDSVFGANGKGGLLKGGLNILGSLFGGGKSGTKLGSSNFGQFLWPKFASGGDFMGGLRLVGEQGPELEATGPSRIFNANQTKDILSGGGRGVHVTYAPVTHIDSRADRASVMQDMQRVNKQGQAELISLLERQGRI
ncbi:tape measure domain-containing protein [Nitrosospira sp. Nl5]|uniref:tape measure protein n=1 Tax=Nitrosospira sp. Nl5 TaxID=200120 RepID=UPI00087E1231|nr:tape measure protein [Nitrosospira sp. Nl5]SCX94293.1 tape measure domain-containing protein [Nitrosospira sp. Nl5]